MVWKATTDLHTGDRVRLANPLYSPEDGVTYPKYTMGTIGFFNSDKAPMMITNTRKNPKLMCERVVNGKKCGGLDGKSYPCNSCRIFYQDVKERLFDDPAQRSPFSYPVFLDYNDNASGSDDQKRKNKFLLAHELEKATPMSGVHVDEWNGCAFNDGDVIAIEDGLVKNKKTGKTTPLAFGYEPLKLSTLPNARTASTVEISKPNQASRFGGQGGCAMSEEPLVSVDGEFTYEIIIKKYKGHESEGLECGVCDIPPEKVDLSYDYAASTRGCYISDDAGSLACNGRLMYTSEDDMVWKDTQPSNLKNGDVITVTVKANGALEIHYNGKWQVRWDKAQIDVTKPLYAVVGMRAPCVSVALRKKAHDLTKIKLPNARAITLKGVEGKAGEVIDLTKCGRPRFPAALQNVRAISDIHSLYPLIVKPWPARAQGRKGAQPILIRAGPGTGKTWCVMQLLYFLAKGSDKMKMGVRLHHIFQGIGTRCLYLLKERIENAIRLEFTPYVVYVQKLARLMNKSKQENGGRMTTDDLVRIYMRAEFEEREQENSFVKDQQTLDMLLQLFESRSLILLIDGIDEAASLKTTVEDYITQTLVPSGHQVIVTSRPEGVRLRLYKR